MVAEAIAEGKAPANACPVASEDVNNQIAQVMGQELEEDINKLLMLIYRTCDKTELIINTMGNGL